MAKFKLPTRTKPLGDREVEYNQRYDHLSDVLNMQSLLDEQPLSLTR